VRPIVRGMLAGLAISGAVLLACNEGVTPDCGNAAVCAPSGVAPASDGGDGGGPRGSDAGGRDAEPVDAANDSG
jgi:hypothetical protein